MDIQELLFKCNLWDLIAQVRYFLLSVLYLSALVSLLVCSGLAFSGMRDCRIICARRTKW